MNRPDLPPSLRRITIVAPHSDDETIAAHTLIERARRHGTDISLIVVTDGAASHRNSPTWPKDRLVAARRRETLRAMEAVGVPRHKLRFLNFPDGGLGSLPAPDYRRLVRRLSRGKEPDLVIMPGRRDAHPDHRDVAKACLDAWPPRVPRWSYGVWHNESAESPPPSAQKVFMAKPARKRAALRRYRTQTGLIVDDPAGFHLTGEQIIEMCGPFERFTNETAAGRGTSGGGR